MPIVRKRKTIGLRDIDRLGSNEIIWDDAVTGFGVRRQKNKVSYILKYRYLGKQRWHTIGRSDEFTPVEARAKAREIKQDIRSGNDPGRKRPRETTVTELCDMYLMDAKSGRLLVHRSGRPKKPKTLSTDRGRIESHINPLLGDRGVSTVTPRDVENFMHDVAGGKTKALDRPKVLGGEGTASRTVSTLSAIFTYAVRNELRSDNPVRGVGKFAHNPRDRRLTDQEYMALGNALRSAEGPEGKAPWPPAVAATKLLVLTGWRRGEALGLKWSEIDILRRTVRLEDTKTGRSVRPLSHAACDVLKTMEGFKDLGFAQGLVFPSTKGGVQTGFRDSWVKIAALAQLPKDVTPHVLRHTFASVAGDLGRSEYTIANLLGHKGKSITAGYVHLADPLLLKEADIVADRIVELMGDGSLVREAQVVPIR
jgi:integrase